MNKWILEELNITIQLSSMIVPTFNISAVSPEQEELEKIYFEIEGRKLRGRSPNHWGDRAKDRFHRKSAQN